MSRVLRHLCPSFDSLSFQGTMVFFMQAGFAMLCAGSVRQKNVKNIMLKNLLDACGGALGFYTLGFGFAWGGDDEARRTFVGNSYFGLRNFDDYITFFFQFAFAATAAALSLELSPSDVK